MLSLFLIYFWQPPAAAVLRRQKTFLASFPAETKNISYQPIYWIHYNTRRHAPPLRPHSTSTTATQHHPTYAVTTAATATLSTSSSSPLRHHFHRAPPPQIHQPPRPPHKAKLRLVLKTAHNGAFGVVLHQQGVRSGPGQSQRWVRCVVLPAERVAATTMGALGGRHRCRKTVKGVFGCRWSALESVWFSKHKLGSV
uniref:Uncharacterized protein n=1 Tax=Tanacetum cinerariifolium TaxID=118510 RepID=A0A699J566_TANCI|nr:hypothetical protein [Tanacetum cinerariifolium]